MTAHTPGPWTYQPACNYVGYSIAPRGTLPTLAAVERPVGGELITVEAFNFPGETEANARLIAAAPTMHEEMQRFLEVIERAEADSEVWTRLTAGTGIATANAYRAAIAKAKGESDGR